MEHLPSTAHDERPAPEPGFTGDVTVSGYDRRPDPSRLVRATVRFAPGARTPWKTNPLGQTIVVTGGAGHAHADGDEPVTLEPGDVVWFPPGQRHWEGAARDQGLVYVAVQEETPDDRVVLHGPVTAADHDRGGPEAAGR